TRSKRDWSSDVCSSDLVFQDPFSSYNPIFPVDRAFDSLWRTNFAALSRQEWQDKVDEAIRSVRLTPEDVLGKYPHQLSGGQLQRSEERRVGKQCTPRVT